MNIAMNTDGEHKKGGEDDDDAAAAAAAEAEIESQYEKYRDDQMNTGVIAALIGGFALTNSWEMGVEMEDYDPNVIIEPRTLSVIAYVLAICAVHACTCSALVSAFLYRNLTRMKSPQDAVQWVHRHPILIETPFYKAGNFISCTILSQLRIVFYLGLFIFESYRHMLRPNASNFKKTVYVSFVRCLLLYSVFDGCIIIFGECYFSGMGNIRI